MIRAIEANVPVRPLDPSRIASDIQCSEPADVDGAHPTGKGLGIDAFRVVSSNSERSKYLHLVIQFWRAGEIAAGFHHCLRSSRDRNTGRSIVPGVGFS